MTGVCTTAVIAALLSMPPDGSAARPPEGADVHVQASRRHRGALTLYAYELDVGPQRFVTKVSERETVVCDAPCDQFVDVSRSPEFYVAGPFVTRSLTFSLPRDGAAIVDVRPGSRPLYILGWVTAITGAAGVVGGAATMTFADRRTDILTTGGIVLGVGAAVLIAGIVMVVTGRTRVRVTPKSGR